MDEKWLGRATATRVRTYRPGDAGYDAALAAAPASGGGLPQYGVGLMPGASWAPPASAPVYPVMMQPIAAPAQAAPSSGTGSANATATCRGGSGGLALLGLVLGALLVLVSGYILYKEGVPILPWKQAAVQQELVKEEEPRVPKKEARLPAAEVEKTEQPQPQPRYAPSVEDDRGPLQPPETAPEAQRPEPQTRVSRNADIPARPPRHLTPAQERRFMQGCIAEGKSELLCGVRLRCYRNRGTMYFGWPGTPAYAPSCNTAIRLPQEAQGVARVDPDWMARFHPDR